MSPQPRRYLIIGSGVAGMAAAEVIRSTDVQADISLITEDPFGYYSRPGLAYYLNNELGEDLLYPFTKKDLKSFNITWVQGTARQILPTEHQVVLANQKRLAYDRLLIATGSTAAPLKVSGAALQGVFKLDSMADTRALLDGARRARSAVIVGGGITALELAEGLHARGLKVTYFLRGDRYWSNVLDETESRIIERRLLHDGIHLSFNTELAEIQGRNGRVESVLTKNGEQLRCELVAFAIGVLPRNELAQTAGLQVDRGILVNEMMQTSQADIFSAGDVAQVYDPFSGQSVLDTLWNTARHEGVIAGLNMAGVTSRYEKTVPFNVTRLAGVTTTIIGTVGRGSDPSLAGIARGDSETWRLLPDAVIAQNSFEVNRLRLLVGSDHLLGAVIMGNQALSVPLQELVGQRVNISSIREELLHTDRIADMVQDFWIKWKVKHADARS